jgi:pimeloyl-ACP methyl ester carboxylesterase
MALIDDSSYWDWPIDPSNYSYVDAATDIFGYTTFSIDRLCAGNSTFADPYAVCQSQAETAVIDALTSLIRNGELAGLGSRPIVHIGHSFGSVLTYLLASQFPNNTDGIVLTGYSSDIAAFSGTLLGGFGLRTAPSNLPSEFGSLDPGYLVYDDIFNAQYLFLYPPFVTQENEEAVEQFKQPLAVGEVLTLASTVEPADRFTGPALVFNGRQDIVFCGGDCLFTGDANVSSIPALLRQNLPNASPFEVIIQPNMGHAINVHLNATGAFKAINGFLDDNNFQ